MQQTLLYIPHEINGLPVFGFGWLLIAWAIGSVGLMGWLIYRYGWDKETASYLPVVLLIAAAIVYLLPKLEAMSADGEPLGLPIRGYGVMLLIAVVSAVLLAARQASRMGVDPEIIFSLAFYVFVGGILGARFFYVLQYWHQFQRETISDTFFAVINMMQGGLVVYGSFIGATVAALFFFQTRKLPTLALADIVAPSLMLGLAIGRIGCLLNGCCHGGLCEFGLTFPMNSPPYLHQHSLGQLHGFTIGSGENRETVVVTEVQSGGPADVAGLRVGDEIRRINGNAVPTLESGRELLAMSPPQLELETDQGVVAVSMEALPARSRPIHATQIYSAVNGGLLCLLTWSFYPFRRRDGEVFALMLTLYPVSRFLLEMIRNDEPGRFGTPFTISQIVSLVLLAAACGLWIYLRGRPLGTLFPEAEKDRSLAT